MLLRSALQQQKTKSGERLRDSHKRRGLFVAKFAAAWRSCGLGENGQLPQVRTPGCIRFGVAEPHGCIGSRHFLGRDPINVEVQLEAGGGGGLGVERGDGFD